LPAVARQNPLFSVSASATPKGRYSWPRKQKKSGHHDEPDRADLGKQSFGPFGRKICSLYQCYGSARIRHFLQDP
jgi:hypothetical protein